MPDLRSRFVLLCQQSLAFAVVVAFAAPAANMVTLDIVAPTPPATPGTSRPGPAATGAARAVGGTALPSLVASRPVRARVTEVPLGGVSPAGVSALGEGGQPASRGGSMAAARLVAGQAAPGPARLAALSAPQPVDNLATVGVTWRHGVDVAEAAIRVSVRTEKDGAWSGWQTMPYHDEHGPDPGTAEARRSRPGTDPVFVGSVEHVQVKAVTDTGDAPVGMTLALVDPGAQSAPAVERPAIDTGKLDLSSADSATAPTTATGAASLSAGTVTPKPMIYSRAQWGADEGMRNKSALRYGEVHAGFVHHTVDANNYTRAQVPAIIRGIYAFHTRSRGWSDIGYNFLVDRFGRIWEGRYGGVDRPVVGAHTLGYNDDAFAMSAIGNYDIAQPSAAMLDAYGRLFAWKLSLHGVRADSPRQWVTKRYLPAIDGHRDVGQTACPGRYLYAKIPVIRALAVQYEKSFTARNRTANLAGSSWPDVVVRDKATKQGYLLRTGGQVGFSTGTTAATGFSGMDLVAVVGDVTGDGNGDLLARTRSTGTTAVYPGDGAGHYGAATRPTGRFTRLDQLTGVGDWNGDGRNDVVGRNATTKRLYVYFGDGAGTFGTTYRLLSADWSGYGLTSGAGDLDHDGRPDLLGRTTDGSLWLVPGTGSGIAAPRRLATGWSGYDLVSGGVDVTNDGRPDVVARSRATKQAYVFPGDSLGGLGAALGPFAGLGGVDSLLSAGQVAGTPAGDLVGRDASGRMRVFTNNGATNVEALTPIGRTFPAADLVLDVGDWNGDGHGDVMTRSSAGNLYLYPGTGTGTFRTPVRAGTGFGTVRLLAAVGDVTGDGHPDLMGQPAGGSMRIYPGDGGTGLRTSYLSHAAITADQQLGLGLWDADGSPDSLFRRRDGALVLYPGNGPGGLSGGTVIRSLPSGYDWLLAVGDVNGDRRPDLLARAVSTGRLWLLPGTSSGFGARRLVAEGLGRFDLSG